MSRIFVSYRRADSIAITGRIYDYLVLVFGEDSIFKDVDDIPLGADFRAVLEREVGSCDALLVVIGPRWASVTHKDGRKRLHDLTDFVRIEVETGLKRGDILVVPVLVDEASMPTSDELPETLHNLLFRNAAIVRHDPDFRRDMERLSKQLQRYFEGSGEVNRILNQLDALPEDAAWVEIEALLEQAQTAADGDATLTDKINARRQYRVGHREQHIAKLLLEAEDLLTAELPDVDQALSILDTVQALAINESHFSEARNHVLQVVDEVRAREQAFIHERRRQQVEALLSEVETLIKQDSLDFARMETLLEEIRAAVSKDETLVNDITLEVRWDDAAHRINLWRQILEERQQAQFEQQRRQNVERMLSEAEAFMQQTPPDIRQAEALLVAFQAENISDEALEIRRRTIRQQIVRWREADSARRKAEADEERRHQNEAKQYTQQNFSQSVNRMDAIDAEARRLSETPSATSPERRVVLPRSRGLTIVAVVMVLVIAGFVFSQRANQAASPTPTLPPTNTPDNIIGVIPNLVTTSLVVNPQQPRCLEPFTVQITLRNEGGQATTGGGVVLVEDRLTENFRAQTSGTQTFPALMSGQAITVEVELTVSTYYDEPHYLLITLDPDNLIYERVDGDNYRDYHYILERGDCLTGGDSAAATALPTAEVAAAATVEFVLTAETTAAAVPPTRDVAAATVEFVLTAEATAAVTAEFDSSKLSTSTPFLIVTSNVTSNSFAPSTATLWASSNAYVLSNGDTNVNVRQGDSTQYPIVGQLRSGESGRVIAISSRGTGWYLVELRDGRYGWIAPTVVTLLGDNASNLTRVEPPNLSETAVPVPNSAVTPTAPF
jgi:hypothetical protein